MIGTEPIRPVPFALVMFMFLLLGNWYIACRCHLAYVVYGQLGYTRNLHIETHDTCDRCPNATIKLSA